MIILPDGSSETLEEDLTHWFEQLRHFVNETRMKVDSICSSPAENENSAKIEALTQQLNHQVEVLNEEYNEVRDNIINIERKSFDKSFYSPQPTNMTKSMVFQKYGQRVKVSFD